ncbi:hypothetical protein QR680_001979 [Steinernema hermaphroditum]|uniref:Condensin complex subunit 2 n=1 Tax=Steinernema hermaphroditum TaxID=289476 RepID=A0AA39H1L7_9BILA|nr:hypothetical protein QR680_001979 [Steinernema hermaphroditum]
MATECAVQNAFECFNRRFLNARKNRRSSLSIRFGIQIKGSGSPTRHNRHKDKSPTPALRTPTKNPPPPESTLTPSQRRKLHEEQENAKIAELLAQTNKKWIGNNFETLLIEKLPDVVERQPLMSIGTLLDASAKIYAYKVDKTLQDCCHAKRDIEKPEKNARKLEKMREANLENGTEAGPTQPDYMEHEINEKDMFRHITRDDDTTITRETSPVIYPLIPKYADGAKSEKHFKIPMDFSLFKKKTKKRNRPPGAPNSDDEYEMVKERNERIRQRCFKITRNPREKLVLTDSSDEECSMKERDAKFFDFFECVQFRNTLLQQDAKKLILKDVDYDPENDEKELYNPRYSKTVRRMGASSSALMLANAESTENGTILLLHDRPFTTLSKKYFKRSCGEHPTYEEVNVNTDVSGIMQQVLALDKRNLRYLFPTVNRDDFRVTMENRRARAEALKLLKEQLEEQLEGPGDEAHEGVSRRDMSWRDELLNPKIFEEEKRPVKGAKRGRPPKAKVGTKKVPKHRTTYAANEFEQRKKQVSGSEKGRKKHKKKRKGEKKDKKKNDSIECMEVDDPKDVSSVFNGSFLAAHMSFDDAVGSLCKLEQPPFLEEDCQLNRRLVNADLVQSLTAKEAEMLGLSPQLLNMIKEDVAGGKIRDEVVSKIGTLTSPHSQNMLLELVFGSAFDDKSVAYDRQKMEANSFQDKEKQMKCAKFAFTEDYTDFDSMWHCNVAAIEAEETQNNEEEDEFTQLQTRELGPKARETSQVYNYFLVRGAPEKPLYWNQNTDTMHVRDVAPGKFRWIEAPPKMQPLTVDDVPKISDLRLNTSEFFEDGRPLEQCGVFTAFRHIESSFGRRTSTSTRGNNLWVAPEGFKPLQLENYDFDEVAQKGPREGVRRVLEGGDDILLNDDMQDLASTSYQDDNPEPSAGPSSDFLGCLERGEDMTELLKKGIKPTECEADADNRNDFEQQALGDLQEGRDQENLPIIVDDAHWKVQNDPEIEPKQKKKRNKILEQLEKTYCDKGYWELFDELPDPLPPRNANRKTVEFSDESESEEDDEDLPRRTSSGHKMFRYKEFDCIIPPSSCENFEAIWPKGRTFSTELANSMVQYETELPEIFLVLNETRRSRRPRSESLSRTMLEAYPEDVSKKQEQQEAEETQETEEAQEAQEKCEEKEPEEEVPATEQPAIEQHEEEMVEAEVPVNEGEEKGEVEYEDPPLDDNHSHIEEVSHPEPLDVLTDEEDDDAMFGRKYKITQSRVNAPLVKMAIAAILANANMEDDSEDTLRTPSPVEVLPEPSSSEESSDEEDSESKCSNEPAHAPEVATVQMPDGTVIVREIKQEVLDEEIEQVDASPEDPSTEMEAMRIRISDFPVMGHHTFTNIMARLPALLNKESVEDLKPSNALTILLHMCNENKLELLQERNPRTNGILESSLADFIIRTSSTTST